MNFPVEPYMDPHPPGSQERRDRLYPHFPKSNDFRSVLGVSASPISKAVFNFWQQPFFKSVKRFAVSLHYAFLRLVS